MKATIVFLLLVGLSLALHPVLPGTRDSNAGLGWDLKHVTQKSVHVLSFDFENNALFTSLSRPYRIPDQLTIQELNEEDTQIQVFTSVEELVEYQNKLHGTSSDSAQPTFEDEYLSKSALKGLNNGDIVVVVKQQKRLFGWNFNEAKITQDFAKAVDLLPSKCESEEERGMYFDFIHRFGSHVLTSAEVGGEIAHIYTIPASFLQTEGKEWIANKIEEHVTLRQSRPRILANQFFNNYEMKVHGASRYARQYSRWEQEIERTPAILNPKFTLISAFIDDEEKKTNLESTISTYMSCPKEHSAIKDTPPGKVQVPNIGFPYDMVTERFRPVSVFQSVQWYPDCSQWDYCFKGLIKPSFPAFTDNEAFKSEDTYARYTDTESYLEEKSLSFTVGGAFYSQDKPPGGGKDGNIKKDSKSYSAPISNPSSNPAPKPSPNGNQPPLCQVSFNTTRTEVYNLTKSEACNIGSNEVVKTIYSLEYFEDIATLSWPISSQFENDAKAIGTEYDEQRFGAFVRKYGTHFLYTATFGGIWNFTLTVSSSTVSEKSAEWVSNKFTAAFNIAKAASLNTTASDSDHTEVGDVEWQAASHNMTQIRGGTQNMDSMTWVNSVEANPELLPVYSEMFPITVLVSQVNPDGATQLMDYLADYALFGVVTPQTETTSDSLISKLDAMIHYFIGDAISSASTLSGSIMLMAILALFL